MKLPSLVLVLVLVLDPRAHADPPNLQLSHAPVRHLRMRARVAASPSPSPSPSTSTISEPPPTPTSIDTDAMVLRDIREPISVRFNLGYEVDGTTLTGKPSLGGSVPNVNPGYPDLSTIHAYGFGEGYFSTRGVGLPSLSTYFASKFQLTQRELVVDPSNPEASSGVVATPPPIATWFDRSGVITHTAWAELADFLGTKKLAPLRVRAGALYVYGPWVMHIYGALAAWDGKLVHAQVYGGSRVPDYTFAASDQLLDRAGIGGFAVRTDLRELDRPVPLVLAVEGLGFTRAGENRPSNHAQVEADWRPNRDLALIGQARWLEGDPANEHVQLRARYSEVTNIVIDVTHRHATDWRWDPSLVGSVASDPLAPKRYLDLGPVLPQYLISARAGTLIAENVDLYGRFAASTLGGGTPNTLSAFAASYVEGGGALELRLRRTIALGINSVTRQTDRPKDPLIADAMGVVQPLAIDTNPGAMGEKGFTELGATMRMNLGARKFSALVEIYGRYTRYERDYCLDTRCGSFVDTGVPDSDVRGGGRFQVDAWIRDRLRLFASYDLSSRLAFAPEITGYKSLRLIMEGVY